jgi:hypothetical protein
VKYVKHKVMEKVKDDRYHSIEKHYQRKEKQGNKVRTNNSKTRERETTNLVEPSEIRCNSKNISDKGI